MKSTLLHHSAATFLLPIIYTSGFQQVNNGIRFNFENSYERRP